MSEKKNDNHSCKFQVDNKGGKNFNRNTCCGVVFGKNCTDKMMEKLWTPLEETYPEIVGKYDEEQELLIQDGSKPVILLENASEMISRMKDSHGFLEQIIDKIIAENKSGYVSLGSYTFEYYLKEETIKRYEGKPFDQDLGKNPETPKLYESEISLVKKAKSAKSKKNMVHIAADLGGVGHYAVLINNGNKTILFDSMQLNGHSNYTPFFSQIGKDIFGHYPETLNLPDEKTCLQLTGGFVTPRRYGESESHWMIRTQNMDSQNHFCFFWAIWYFHFFIAEGEQGLEKFLKELNEKCNHPLVIIKRYIWAVVNSLYPTDTALKNLFKEIFPGVPVADAEFMMKFFLTHFRYVWDNLDTDFFYLFSIIDCGLSQVRNLSLNECLDYSQKNLGYVLDGVTVFPSVKKNWDVKLRVIGLDAIPIEDRSYELCAKAVMINPKNFAHVPYRLRTPQMYAILLKNSKNSVSIPPDLLQQVLKTV